MEKNLIYDRKNNKKIEEKIYFEKTLNYLYKDNFFSKILLTILCRFDFLSNVYGFLNRLKSSKKKIDPFIKTFRIDEEEFVKNKDDFLSFEEFFIRKLKKDARKIDLLEDRAALPCDGKFLVFENIEDIKNLSIKGEEFNLKEFLNEDDLFEKYKDGAMLLCRLAPQDYHRFHFPIDCNPQESKLINGYLFSVNPIALKTNINILSQNKRVITKLKSKKFSDILYIEIGATNVGSIKQTFIPNNEYKKADEKGYFTLGASSIVLLFKKDTISFDKDLIEMSKKNIETKSYMGVGFATLR